MPKFILHWLDGKEEKVEGETIARALMAAGYGAGAVRALDYFEEPPNENLPEDKARSVFEHMAPSCKFRCPTRSRSSPEDVDCLYHVQLDSDICNFDNCPLLGVLGWEE